MSVEIFHLAADGCEIEATLTLEMTDHVNYIVADVLSYTVAKSAALSDFDHIENSVAQGADKRVNRLTWTANEIRRFLGLHEGAPVKCKHLISYFGKRYNFRLEF